MIERAGTQSLPELGVIGWPLEKTFSPPMFAAALSHAGLEWRYEAIPVGPEDLGVFLRRAAEEMRGFNVTIPHKAGVRESCFVADELARACGAVNTVVSVPRSGRRVLEGYNTDGPGLLEALRLRAGFDPQGAIALILGSGGAAAGCAAALAKGGASRVILANRTLCRAAELAARLERSYAAAAWSAVPLEALLGAAMPPGLPFSAVDITVNCIPEEHAPRIDNFFHLISGRRTVFCDMSYSTVPSRLLTGAREAGCRLVPGIEVLLRQGTFGFEIMTGLKAPENAMRDALTAVTGGWWLDC